MLLPIGAHSESDQVIDYAAVEAQNHVRINLVHLVLIVADNVVEAAMGVDLRLHCDAILYILKLLVQDVHTLPLIISRTNLLFLFVRACIVLIKVIAFDRLLHYLYDFLALVLFVGRSLLSRFHCLCRVKPLVVNHLVNLGKVLLLSGWNPQDLLVSILTRLIPEENIDGTIIEDHNELVGVLALNHGLEPPDVHNFPAFLHLGPLVVLDDDASIPQLRVKTAYRAGVGAQEQLNLRLVPHADLVFTLLS